MSGKTHLAQPASVVYLYDGSLPGFLCCVYESVYSHELPAAIQNEAEAQPTLFQQKRVAPDPQRARKVADSIPQKIGPRAWELVEAVFLSCLEEKELALLRFLLLGYEQGRKTPFMHGNEVVSAILKAERHLKNEAHLLLGFVRFADYGEGLGAVITPKNFVLPFMAGHFAARYPREAFMIYDKTHKAALVHQKGKCEIIHVESITFPEETKEEKHYQALWQQFYKTISIEARENPRCRMTHMPKRYWENMLEVSDLL